MATDDRRKETLCFFVLLLTGVDTNKLTEMDGRACLRVSKRKFIWLAFVWASGVVGGILFDQNRSCLTATH